jgi:hydroxyethylthiazole kinase-like uncharacterized protein yjeF
MLAEDVKVLDINSEYCGTPTLTLMENAGKGVADIISKKYNGIHKTILVLCGMGNNGGDGLVAARYLANTNDVTVFLIGKQIEIKTAIAQKNYTRLQKTKATIYDISELEQFNELLKKADIIVDAMLGIGIKGRLREPFSFLVPRISSMHGKTLISVDVPTGMGTKTALKPEATVTFHDAKQGMTKDNSGTIYVVDIGIPQQAVDYVGPGQLSVYYPRPSTYSHKGDNGKVLIIGGGPYIGAPALSAFAALRTGADLVFIATPKTPASIIPTYSPNFIVHALSSEVLIPADVASIDTLIKMSTSAIIGPGLGSAQETKEAILQIIQRVKNKQVPLVIDADAIPPISEHIDLIHRTTTVITPHRGEFKILTGLSLSPDKQQKNASMVQQWAKKTGVTVLLKAPVDILTDGTTVKFNSVHNEAMTVGGTGDVLAGIVGALLAKQVPPMRAVQLAAFLNGAAGNRAFATKSYGLLATDIIEEIPNVLHPYL